MKDSDSWEIGDKWVDPCHCSSLPPWKNHQAMAEIPEEEHGGQFELRKENWEAKETKAARVQRVEY